VENRKLKKKKTDMLRSIGGKQSGGIRGVKSVLQKIRKAIRLEGFAEKESFKPRMKERGGDGIAY